MNWWINRRLYICFSLLYRNKMKWSIYFYADYHTVVDNQSFIKHVKLCRLWLRIIKGHSWFIIKSTMPEELAFYTNVTELVSMVSDLIKPMPSFPVWGGCVFWVQVYLICIFHLLYNIRSINMFQHKTCVGFQTQTVHSLFAYKVSWTLFCLVKMLVFYNA